MVELTNVQRFFVWKVQARSPPYRKCTFTSKQEKENQITFPTIEKHVVDTNAIAIV
jgi:hypothetical protein